MKVNETDSAGITLLKKGHRGLIRALFSRLGLIVALLLVQALVLLALAYWFETSFSHIYSVMVILSVCIVLYIAAKRPAPYSWTLTRENYNDTGTWPELTQSTGTPG